MKDKLMLHARDKTVQRMTKDGLVEENVSAGSSERVSGREAEKSFGKKIDEVEFRKRTSKKEASSKSKKKYYRQKPEVDKDGSKSDSISKLEHKAKKADVKVEKAKQKLPKKKVVKYQRLYDEQSGKTKHRLQFKDEIKKAPSGTNRFIGNVGYVSLRTGRSKATADADDNSAVEAMHSTENVVMDGFQTARNLSDRHETNLHKKVSKLEHKAEKAHIKLQFEKNAAENPELKKSVVKQMQQKKQIKKDYQRAQKAAQTGKRTAGNAGKTVGKTADKVKEKLVQFVTKNKSVLAIVGICILVIVLMSSMLSSCAAMFSTGGGAITTSTYLSTDEAIVNTNNAYSDFEDDLQSRIDRVESDYPDYDEYRYNVDEIDHDPYALTSYLTARYGNYKESDVSGYLPDIFDLQYDLTITPTVETRTRTETRTGYRIKVKPDGTTYLESYEYDVEVEYDYYILTVTLTNHGLDAVVTPLLNEDQLREYRIYQASSGNRAYLFGEAVSGNVAGGGINYDIPPEALEDEAFRSMILEAEKYLGYPYVWGGSSPETSFDCSGFVCWVINHSVGDVGRTTANGLLGCCTYVSPDDAKPGDLVFFEGTYNTSGASHVGIYVGNGMMIHCGNPIQYASIETTYWQNHFYCFGRID